MTDIDILLIEDSLSDSEMTIRVLTKNHLAKNLIHVEDGAAALDYIFGGDQIKKPKVIILDLNMPKISGLEVLHKIRENPKTKFVPIVVLSSSKEPSDVHRCYEMGVNSYLVKPVEFRQFNQTIMNLVQYWLNLNQNTY